MEQPVLGLGLLGFAEPAGLRLQEWAAQAPAGWPMWRSCDPHLADAWMIAGDAVEVLGRDEVVIRHPFGSGERLTLNRAEVDRPLAFATPLPEGFASAEFFEADSETSVRQRLQRFEAWLRPLRTQFALGAELIERLHQYRSGGVVHVTLGSKLLAVIDIPRWQAALSIPARPVDLSMAEWIHGDKLSREVPPSFIRLPLYRVMWGYAVRTQRDVLPARYRGPLIYLRRVPRLPAHWFDARAHDPAGHLLPVARAQRIARARAAAAPGGALPRRGAHHRHRQCPPGRSGHPPFHGVAAL